MSEILNNIYIWVFLVNSESVQLLAFVKYIFYRHCTSKLYFFCTFWRLKILVLWQKIIHNLRIFVCLFCPKNSTTDFGKSFITQERSVLKSCLTPRWIAFLLLCRLVYKIHSHFNELILAAFLSNKIGEIILSLMERFVPSEIFLANSSPITLWCINLDNVEVLLLAS